MSKRDITRSCGHVETVNICGPYKDRDRKAEYEAGRLCYDCYRAQQAKAQQGPSDQDLMAEMDLPALDDSHDQQALADRIRRRTLLGLARLGAARTGSDEEDLTRVRLVMAHVIRMLAACEWSRSAAWWVEHKDMSPTDLADAINQAQA